MIVESLSMIVVASATSQHDVVQLCWRCYVGWHRLDLKGCAVVLDAHESGLFELLELLIPCCVGQIPRQHLRKASVGMPWSLLASPASQAFPQEC